MRHTHLISRISTIAEIELAHTCSTLMQMAWWFLSLLYISQTLWHETGLNNYIAQGSLPLKNELHETTKRTSLRLQLKMLWAIWASFLNSLVISAYPCCSTAFVHSRTLRCSMLLHGRVKIRKSGETWQHLKQISHELFISHSQTSCICCACNPRKKYCISAG